MIRRSEERNVETKANLFCGLGEVTVRHLLNGPDEMYGKGRVFATPRLRRGVPSVFTCMRMNVKFTISTGDGRV